MSHCAAPLATKPRVTGGLLASAGHHSLEEQDDEVSTVETPYLQVACAESIMYSQAVVWAGESQGSSFFTLLSLNPGYHFPKPWPSSSQ